MNKTIGLIGGMTPESTILYYRELNRLASIKYGAKHTCNVLIESVDFGMVSKYQIENRWDLLDEMMVKAAQNLEKGGAKCVLICANTMHLTIEAVKKKVTIPVLHIAQATSLKIKEKQLRKVALLGTKYTMEKTFYTDVLSEFGIETLLPNEKDREIVHAVIYDELAFGEVTSNSKKEYLRITEALISRGAEG
ncbi:MAG: amino acid racemase, partial [Flavobacteriaceae bacterium]|nr:amino acid racemase [Flavobacteriaceae bacterium]